MHAKYIHTYIHTHTYANMHMHIHSILNNLNKKDCLLHDAAKKLVNEIVAAGKADPGMCVCVCAVCIYVCMYICFYVYM